eukprot:2594485-Rhodomonas_salina.1
MQPDCISSTKVKIAAGPSYGSTRVGILGTILQCLAPELGACFAGGSSARCRNSDPEAKGGSRIPGYRLTCNGAHNDARGCV